MAYNPKTREQAQILYEAGVSTVVDIAKQLNIKREITILDWANKYGWTKRSVGNEIVASVIKKDMAEQQEKWNKSQSKHGEAMMKRGATGLDEHKETKLSVRDCVSLLKEGADIQRKAELGLVDENPQNVINILNLIKMAGE